MIKEKFTLSGKARMTFILALAIGLVLIILGAVTGMGGSSERFWTNWLLSTFYFGAISVLAVAWIAINYLAKAGWSAGFKRIAEAIGSFIPVAGVSMLLLVIATFIPMGEHHGGLYQIYHWLHLGDPHVLHDPILEGKRGFLNQNFFIIRLVLYFAIWIIFYRALRRQSLKEDGQGGLAAYHSSVKLSAAFLPLFGLTFCLACFDWMMSIEPHWFSTIYAVNIFAGALVSCCAFMVLILVLLKRSGYMPFINENHFHDLGKFMFGFSIFWTYTWISQFLLIWYANIPEETQYYFDRLHGNWQILFFLNFGINFIVPFLALMMRNAKRRYSYLVVISAILLCGRFLDWYLLSMPGAVGANSGFGFYEIGFFLLFAGSFALVVTNTLSKANLVPVNHPFLGESLHHEI